MDQSGGSGESRPTFDELVALTRRVIAGFDQREQRPWGVEVTMIELAKQVGDLARQVMMAESYYLPDRADDPRYATTTDRIGDELADILYCVIRLAGHYGIDLASAQLAARRRELVNLGLDVREEPNDGS